MKLYQLLTVLSKELHVKVYGQLPLVRSFDVVACDSCDHLLRTLSTDDLFREVTSFDVAFPDCPIIRCGRSSFEKLGYCGVDC